MISLSRSVAGFLKYHTSLGYKMNRHELYLQNFLSFLKQRRARVITNQLSLGWAMLPRDVTPYTWALRLQTIRRFAKYRFLEDPRTEIPHTELLPIRYRRRHPYIYSDDEIRRLLAAAQLPAKPFWGIDAQTAHTAFGLVATTGIRRSELINLNQCDVDLTGRIIKIHNTKFNKSRLVPIHSTVTKRLQEYAQHRKSLSHSATDPFFLTKRGHRLSTSTVNFAFSAAAQQAGLRGDVKSPRLHDLRHSFAVRLLIEWLKQSSVNVDQKMPALSTYLGHANPSATYWYLSCVPELMRLAKARMEEVRGPS